MSKIIIESGVLKNIGEMAKENFANVKTFAVVSDDNVAPLYGKAVADALADAGFGVISYTIKAGEKSKNMVQYAKIQNHLAESKMTRSDAIVALGGGVVGDLAGFVAATYLRGVEFVQVPTTLLAMVDSSVGGKTAIDIPAGKNLVGAFHQPKMVVCDPLTLNTLPTEIFSSGYAEVIKHGMIKSKKLLKMLAGKEFDIKLSDIIEENINIKRDIVSRDEFDTGERQLLNFGHTVGHAIEKLSKYKILHGRAVAIGMYIMTKAAVKKGVCDAECLEVLDSLLCEYGLPDKANYKPKELYEAALGDKKRMGDTITEIIPREVGFCELQKMPVEELLEWITMGVSE
ncbi:MAG: 3-dehydroquinate synthase [Defluviitaleaceae bacterium]|nr:3-dehydroquinate synthase [Defluviitaleaceae bacterium]